MRIGLIVASLAVLAAACSNSVGAEPIEAGPQSKRDFDVGPFDSVSLAGSHDVVVRVGENASVRAEGPANMLESLEIEVRDGDLHIGTRKGNWSFRSAGQGVTVYVTTPSLRAASIGGSGDMKIDRVEGDRFAGSIGGSGDMKIDQIRAGEAEFSIAGSGAISAAGSAGRSSFSIAGSGDIDADRLDIRSASISVVGSGSVAARVTQSAEISSLGSGDVSISGPAKCNVTKLGSGEVRCHG